MAEMGFFDAVRSVLSKYATFAGRARRAEYWWFTLFNLLVSSAFSTVDISLFGTCTSATTGTGFNFDCASPGVFSGLWSLAMLLPGLAVWVRRLHDIGKSGWWTLLVLIPLIGWIMLFVYSVRRGDTGPNAYGPDPVAG